MSHEYESQEFGFGSHEEQDDGFDGALFGTGLLQPDEASRLVDRGPGRLAVWLGEQGTGKTSISVELYERQRRPGAVMRFAGSWTLLALERLAHERRVTGSPPAATRTDLDPEGREILHLALSAGDVPMHLLVADLPGEVFRRLADNQIAVGDILWLRRADKLAILVDGARLCDAAERSSTLTRVRQLAERLRSDGLPRAGTGLALAVTKWDLVRADPTAVAYWREREGELLAELRVLDPGAVALHVAASDPTAADGVVELRAWLLDISPPSGELEPTDWSPVADVAGRVSLSEAAGVAHSTDIDARPEGPHAVDQTHPVWVEPAPAAHATAPDATSDEAPSAAWVSEPLHPTEANPPPQGPRAAADKAPLFAWVEAGLEPHATQPDSTSGEAPSAQSGSDAVHPAQASPPPHEPHAVDHDAHPAAWVEPAAAPHATVPDSTSAEAPWAEWVSEPMHPTGANPPPHEPHAVDDEAHPATWIEPAPEPRATEPDSTSAEVPSTAWESMLIETHPAEGASPPEAAPPAQAGSAPQEQTQPAEDGPAVDDAQAAAETSPADVSPPIEWPPPEWPATTSTTSAAVAPRFAWPEEPQRRRRWLPWRRRR